MAAARCVRHAGAWDGGCDGAGVRLEAAAVRGAPTYVRLQSSWMQAPGFKAAPQTSAASVRDLFNLLVILGSVLVLAALAARNLRHGSGDRRGAFRLAALVVIVGTPALMLQCHWTPDFQPILMVCLGAAAYSAGRVWLYYVGFEPYVRRRWPVLLIAWTRLLEGRWRDPLVGRAVLAGTAVGMVSALVGAVVAMLARLLSLPAAPYDLVPGTLNSSTFYLGFAVQVCVFDSLILALASMAILLLFRLILRHTTAAWCGYALIVLLFAIVNGRAEAAAQYSALALGVAATLQTAAFVAVFARGGGLLAAVVYLCVTGAVANVPWTLDPSRWYAWRGGFVIAFVLALAFWGFKNALGRQSMFPEGALDA